MTKFKNGAYQIFKLNGISEAYVDFRDRKKMLDNITEKALSQMHQKFIQNVKPKEIDGVLSKIFVIPTTSKPSIS